MTDATPGFRTRTDTDVQRAIFIIESRNDTGSGFLIQDSHHILTAYHVVEGTQQVRVKVHNVGNAQSPRDYITAKVEKVWETSDVALLHLDEAIQHVEPLCLSSQELSVNMQVRTFGFPGLYGEGWHRAEIAGGPLNGKYDIDFKTNYPDTLGGLSGAPIFLSEDRKCLVVGIITNHGPLHLQRGKIVPREAFYNELNELLEKEREESIWCYVVLSGADIRKKERNDLDGTLEQAVKIAFEDDEQVNDGTKRVVFDIATELTSSLDHYKNAIKKICQARIAIFDVTDFEPMVMLLLGVRAVVRRGVTIVSTGDFVIGSAFDIPFNIKELTISSHAREQYLEAKSPPQIIHDKVEEGLSQLLKLPQYLDLPVFDAVRYLPPDYRAPDPLDVLILCSYSKQYQEDNWINLERRLRPHISIRSERKGTTVRILDLNSPRLVSSTIYEAIRRKDLCLVDWTEWRPNVFFEFGVRLAMTGSKSFTISIIEGREKQLMQALKDGTRSDDDICKLARIPHEKLTVEKEKHLHLADQYSNLLNLFDPLVYYTRPFTNSSDGDAVSNPVPFDSNAYKNMLHYYKYQDYGNVTSDLSHGRARSFTYEVIEAYIDIGEEPACIPVYMDLLRSAELFGVEGENNQTAVLYPKNVALNRNVENGVTQRLLAAWYYLRQEYTDEEKIINDADLFDAYQRIGLKLHDHILESRPRLAEDILKMLKALQQKKENNS